MKQKETTINEARAYEKLKEVLSKIGFDIVFSDNDSMAKNPDFIAQKKVGDLDYKIAVELKVSPNVHDAVRYGILQLTRLENPKEFNKLLLLILNKDNLNKNSYLYQKYSHSNPTNLDIISLHELDQWSSNLPVGQVSKESNTVLYYVKELSRKFIELIANNPNTLNELEWRDLERTIAELFDGIGFKTTLTPSSKDGGKDVILECKVDDIQKTFIIEIKHWRSGQKVGKAAVKEFTQVIVNEKRAKGLFLSTYGFSDNFYESLTEKEKTVIRFGEQEKIIELCSTYEKMKAGIWTPVSNLESVLFDNTVSLG